MKSDKKDNILKYGWKHVEIDLDCVGCDFKDADCIIEKDRHICMPEKRVGYKVINGVLETIETIEGF